MPQHRQAGQLRAELVGHPLPQVVDPVGAGVLEEDLGLTGLQLTPQPVAQLLLHLRGDGLLGDLAGVGSRVDGADRDRVEQPLVELGHPQRFVVAAGVALVGLDLGLGDVEAQPLEGARHAARPAASRSRDDDELHLALSWVCHEVQAIGARSTPIRLRVAARNTPWRRRRIGVYPRSHGNHGVTAARPRQEA